MPDLVVSLQAACSALIAHHKTIFEEQRALRIIPRRCDLYVGENRLRVVTTGAKLLRTLRGALASFDESNSYMRSRHQREFHESMIAACARHIFGDEFNADFARILAENNWTEARQEPVNFSQSTSPHCS